MDSLIELYKIGYGPSSSHTMGPKIAAERFKERNLNAFRYEVYLYGSLASTGKGHLTDYIILHTLGIDKCKVIFEPDTVLKYHPNGMRFVAFDKNECEIDNWLVFSVGGGELREENDDRSKGIKTVYKEKNMNEIIDYCVNKKMSLYDYIIEHEGKDIYKYGESILNKMISSVEKGLDGDGILPGKLKISKKAKSFYNKYLESKEVSTLVFASSLAVAEENASGNEIVTAPTCGSSGVVPGVLYTLKEYYKIEWNKLVEGLLVGGLIGNIIKQNGSISGAEVGCQGEVGVACTMAAAAIAYIKGGTIEQIEYASEIALEHHLGLTCDPVLGYVQIPCIERNAIACKRAFDACDFALLTDGKHNISLDDAIKAMLETGKDLMPSYRETSIGGLAKRKDV